MATSITSAETSDSGTKPVVRLLNPALTADTVHKNFIQNPVRVMTGQQFVYRGVGAQFPAGTETFSIVQTRSC